MKKLIKDNVILRPRSEQEERELKLLGYKEYEEDKQKQDKSSNSKKASSK